MSTNVVTWDITDAGKSSFPNPEVAMPGYIDTSIFLYAAYGIDYFSGGFKTMRDDIKPNTAKRICESFAGVLSTPLVFSDKESAQLWPKQRPII